MFDARGEGRFSNSQQNFLIEQRVGRIATTNADGTVHLVPVCFAFDGTNIFTTIISGSKRLSNMRRNRAVSFVVDGYEENEGEWVVLKGILIYALADLLNYRIDAQRFMVGWRLLVDKYPQYKKWGRNDLTPVDSDRRWIVMLTPQKVVAWGF
jgi:hypothetical protein